MRKEVVGGVGKDQFVSFRVCALSADKDYVVQHVVR